jgi:hypothetical protein
VGKSQRTKGHSYERRIARLLRRLFEIPYWRVDEARTGKGIDVEASVDRRIRAFGLASLLKVQAKAREKLSFPVAYAEAADSPLSGPSDLPLLWSHKNHGRHLVTMDEVHLLALVYMITVLCDRLKIGHEEEENEWERALYMSREAIKNGR